MGEAAALLSAVSGGEEQAYKYKFSVPSGALDLLQSHNLHVQGLGFVLICFSTYLVKMAKPLRKIIGFDMNCKFLALF